MSLPVKNPLQVFNSFLYFQPQLKMVSLEFVHLMDEFGSSLASLYCNNLLIISNPNNLQRFP